MNTKRIILVLALLLILAPVKQTVFFAANSNIVYEDGNITLLGGQSFCPDTDYVEYHSIRIVRICTPDIFPTN